MSNTITAYFRGRVGVTESLYQYDYGIVMILDGIYLPANFDCYFSVSGSDEAIPVVGADNRVAIPNSVLAISGKVEVHIPLHTGENDSEVEYVVYTKVIGRARPIDDGTEAEVSAVSEAVALLQHTNATVLETIDDDVSAYMAENSDASIKDWLDDHPEATTTVQDGAVTADKLSSLIRKSPFYDVTRYGILPDTDEDLYELIFDFLHDVVADTGGTVYFPQGTYKISDTIFIPPNTVFMGAGPATRIFFTEEYPNFGVGLSNGGSNVGVVNMTVDHNDNSEIVYGSMTGSIGFTTRTFDSWTTKHESPSSHASCSNVFAEDLWTNTRYILQTETRQTGIGEIMTNISYRNIHAKKSLISVMGHEDNSIYDVTIENVECALLRIGTTNSRSNNDVIITNARMGRLWLMGDNITIYDSFLFPELKYDDITIYSTAMMFYGNDLINNGRINMVNCYIDASNYTIAFARSMAKLRLINTIIEGSTSQLGLNVDTIFADQTEVIGCRLETDGTNATEFSGRMESTIFPTLRYSSKVQSAWMGRQRIESGTDLNDIKVAGGRFESHGTTATSLVNVPSEVTGVFFLDVDSQLPTDSVSGIAPYYIQKLTLLNCSAVYLRSWNGSTWSQWYKYTGTAVS